MAKSGSAGLAFIADLERRAAPAFQRECRELEEFKARQTGAPAGRLAPWEIAYSAEKLRQEQYAFDEEQLRPYFPLDRVVQGMFALVQRVFGLQVVPHAAGDVEVWHPEV